MKKKSERRNTSFRRKSRLREPYDVILIVCEGSKTEPDYFKALKNRLRLSNANISICGRECGTAPISVVDFALQKQKEKYEYDRIFCVFDKDQHETYDAALDKIRSQPRKNKIEAINSIPCFEYWLLLHFENITRPYQAVGNRSICEQVIRDLGQHIQQYEKGMNNVFELTYPLVNEAIRQAERREVQCIENGTDNPSTKVHHLVKYLQNIVNN